MPATTPAPDQAGQAGARPVRALWRLLAPLYRRRWRALLLAGALAGITLAAGVGLLGVSGWFLTAAALSTAGVAFNLFAPSALVRGLSFVRILARYGERVTGHAATLQLLADLRSRIFGKLLALDAAQLGRWRDGELVARLTGDVDAVDTVFLQILVPMACALAGGLALALALGLWLPGAGWLLAAAALGSALLLPAWLAWRSRAPGQAAQQALADLRGQVLQAVEGHADLRGLDAEPQALRAFARSCRQAGQARRRQAALGSAGQAGLQLLAGAAVLAVLVLGLDALRAGTLSGPMLAGLLLATLGFFEVAGPLMRGAARLGGAVSAGARIAAVAALRPAIGDPLRPQAPPQSSALRMEQVGYGYRAGRPVLQDVTLRAEPGRRIALAGASGSGKSTLLHLLLRLADPDQGRVLLGGRDLRDLRLADVHARIALLSQHAPVFLGTLRSNLLIGAPDADDERLWRALEAVGLAGFVRGLPEGLDTWTGETGRSLSAGQARRLCLARVLLGPAQVLLLDEPTEGLDAQAERAFWLDLPQAAAGRTVIIATHARLPAGVVDETWRLHEGRLQDRPEAA
ncbi:thiol reductant ABC exporter subunit CydC [Orrella sp. JC864]|uniref:thiol reductant ABC exporter subunit CydC n=1 Tax=Orrella sp. JC864 TaxID=3120298 RepID=UPI00300AB491